MATLLGNCFSTVENQVPQCDVGSPAETLVIHFDQEKFKQLLSGGGTSLLHVRKHKKVSVARAPLATSWEQVSVETIEALCEPITASREPKQAPCEPKQALREPISVSTETNLAPRQCINIAREARKVPCESKTASAKTIEITPRGGE